MGTFTYQAGPRVHIDDRVLAHVQQVIATKLRRNESFVFSWCDGDGDGRTSVWLHPAIPVWFTYGGAIPALNQAWIEALMQRANGPAGMCVVPEPAESLAGDDDPASFA